MTRNVNQLATATALLLAQACTVGGPPDPVDEDRPDGTAGGVIVPERGFGGFDGVHVFQIPVATDLRGEVTWQVDPARGAIEARPVPPDVADTPLQVWGLLTVRSAGTLTLAAAAGEGRVEASIAITAYDPAEIAIGEQRYRSPRDPGAPGRASCASCHDKPDGHDHSAYNTMYWSDAELLRAIRTGQYTDDESLTVDHAWDVREDEARGILGYLRSLPPRGF